MNRYLLLFKNRDFRFLTMADAVSVLGDQIGWVALLWFVTTTTKDPGTVGLIGLAYGLPGVLFGSLVGNILDKVSHKTVLFMANALLGVVFMVIPYLYSLHDLSRIMLLLLVVIAGCLIPFTSVGWMVIVPNLVSADELGLANAVVETIWNSSMFLGPLVGGLLIAEFGAPISVLADGISFWMAAICVLLLKGQHQEQLQPAQNKSREQSSFWRDAWNGFTLLYELKVVWWVTIAAVLLTMAEGQLEVSLPLFTHRELSMSALVLGSFWTTYFLSSIAGSVVGGLIQKNSRNGMIMAFMVLGWGISFVPMIWYPSLLVTYICMALAGFLFSGYPPLARTTVQRLVPKNYQGRIMGIRGSIIAVGPPVGSYLSGILGEWVSSSAVIGYTGVAMILVGLLLLALRSFRTI